MTKDVGKYNIKAMCNLLGIQAGTLRAWERRYQFIEPVRNEAGHRLYTEEQLIMLKWIVAKINQGFTVGQAMSLLQQNQSEINEKKEDFLCKHRTDQLLFDLQDTLLSFEEIKAQKCIDEAFALYSSAKVVNDILMPLKYSINHRKENEEVTMSQLHFINTFIRKRLTLLMNVMQTNQLLPKIIITSGPNEADDVTLLFYEYFLKSRGFQVVNLGASIPIEEIHLVIKEVKPDFLFFASMKKENEEGTKNWAEQLSNMYDCLSVGLVGQAFFNEENNYEALAPYFVGICEEEWEKWLYSRLEQAK